MAFFAANEVVNDLKVCTSYNEVRSLTAKTTSAATQVKALIRDSRLKSTEHVVQALARNPRTASGAPKVVVNASAIGFPAPWIVLSVALEAVTITVAAGIVAVAISLSMGALINIAVASQYGLDSLYRADASLFVLIFALAALLGVISGVLPARKAASVDPVEVLRQV